MKNVYLKRFYFLSLALALICTSSQAKNIYISSKGSNANNGLSPATPWQTIAKLNSSFSTIQPGDSILFKSGETFTGSIMVTKSGTTSSPIVIGSYGTGAKPVISGLTTLTGWTNVSGNIWQANIGTLKADVNVLTIDGVPQAVGRTDWMVYQSSTATQLTSSSFSGKPSYIGAEIVMRKGVFVAERATITAQSGTTVTYASKVPGIHNGKSASLSAGKANYGFFLQRFAGSLDKQGEWYYNASTDKMMIYSTTNPSNYSIKASYVDTLINLNKQTNITIANLSLEGAGIYAIESYGGTNVTIKNCSFDNNTKAIYVWNTNDITIDGNTINNSFNNAILVSNNQTKRINVNNNTITNTGQLFGMGIFNHEYSLRGIVARTDTTRASNYLNIIGNKVINSGNAAIQFQGSNVIVRRNVTDTFCNQIDDNGGIYTFINNSSVNNLFYTNRVVDSNFISNAIGAPESANGGVDVTGLYFDDQTNNIVAKHNTIWNVPGNGIQLNNPLNITITENTVYNCTYLVWINKKEFGDIKGTVITKNVLHQKDASQYNYGYTNYNLSSPKMTVVQSLGLVDIDNNWISNLQTGGYYYYYSATGGTFTFPPKLTLSQWKSTYANDVNSVLSAKATPTNTKIEFNTSNKAKTVSFNGQSYVDAKGTVYNNSATIPAWSNLVLISNGAAVSTNTPPVAQAPANISITLPVNTVTLAGKGTDKEGAISSYSWTKISGPYACTIESVNAATTVVSALTEGTYKFELSVKDSKGLIGKDTTIVTVNKAVLPVDNKPPHAQGNKDTTITLPIKSMLLSGVNSSDADGSISSYAWTKISGPSGSTFGTPHASVTTFGNLVEGSYTVDLMVTDDKGTIDHDQINIQVLRQHIAPIVNAGEDIAINAPTNKTTLVATVIVDGAVSSYAWTKISGPSAYKIESANEATTVISALVEGTYKFELSVKDSEGLTGKDTTTVTVIKANTPPVSHAPANLSITLPVNTVTLEGYGTDAEGPISSSSWRKTAGPSAYTIESANTGTTVISGLVEGIYTFELSVTDSEGLIGKDWTVVTVIKANTPPVAQAPTDQSITLPVNTVTLSGTGIDEEGAISSYYWSKISGPSAGTIESVNAATTVVSGLVQGTYKFELSVKDSEGLIGKDTTTVTVIKANTPPVSHAPANLSITLPVNTVTLEGYGTDGEGAISSSSWRKTAGPSAYTIESANTGTTVISGLVEGIYTFELSVTDSEGLIGKDWTVVTVIKANTPPVAQAPTDQSITLPVNTVTLSGTGIDEEGAISSYYWSKISGPSAGTIESVNEATTVVSGLVQGTYKFELSVKDSEGLTGKDTTTVTVIKANTPPVSHAPANLSITLPVNTVTLEGYGTDGEGAISSSSWRKTAGPSAYTIESANTGTTVISGLVEGIYTFELSVTDSEGLIGKDWTVVTVIKANTPPVSHAPANLSITLPVNKVTLEGYGTDEEGAISSSSWRKTAGPSAYTIESANTGTTVISGLVEGIYTFELSVTDSEGLIGKDWTVVTVIKANTPPVSHAPANLSITLPVNKVTLEGYGTDEEGGISSSSWRKTAGPSAYTIESANTGTTVISGLVEGTYTFELSVTDSEGLIGKDWTVVTVIKANTPPVSHAPANLSITLPVNKVTLEGYGTDEEGPISSSSWRKLSGPSAYTIESVNTGTTVISGLVEGIYKFELSVKDNEGLIGTDLTVVTVNKATHKAPVVNAGSDIAITAPTNKTTIAGTAIVEGTVSSYAWRKISGPVSVKIGDATSAKTLVSKLVEGVYKFELTVKDNTGATGKDTVQVTVRALPKQAPLPQNESNLASKATNDTTSVNGSVNTGAVGKDTVQATTKAAGGVNHMPIASLVKAYPNPVKDVTNLDITTIGRSVLTISVIDISGKVVKYNGGINLDKKGTIKLDMSNLHDGYYIITVRFNNGELISTRVIKQGGR